MPELPDVEVFRRRLEDHALHRRVARVKVRDERVVQGSASSFRRHLKGHRLERTTRHGKWLFAATASNGRWLALHFGMTGDLVPQERGAAPPKYTRFLLAFEGGPEVAVTSRRRLGKVTLAKTPEAFADERGLGPDACAVTRADFMARVGGKNTTIKAALMDQSVVAGLGNIYTDEVLFHARVAPTARVADLDDRALGRIHGRIGHVVDRAVAAEVDARRMPRGWLIRVRDDRSARCPRCGARLERARLGGRTTVWCPRDS